MPGWGWALIVVAVVVVLAALAWVGRSKQRKKHLEGRFGPEYERSVRTTGDRKQAETELAERESRRKELDVRPLSAESARRSKQLPDQLRRFGA